MRTGILAIFLHLVLMSTSFNQLSAKDIDLSAANINNDLLLNANAVIRYSDKEITIEAFDKIYVVEKYAITILNQNGAGYGKLLEYYDKYIRIDEINGELHDAEGKIVKTIKKKDIKDVSLFDNNFVDDARQKIFDFEYHNYPYTCIFEVRKRYNASFSMPKWLPQFGSDCSVENATLQVKYHLNYPLKYRAYHLNTQPEVSPENETNKLSASVSNIPSFTPPDDFSIVETSYVPYINFVSDKFMIDGKQGSFSSWSDFGTFVYNLNANRDELPLSTKNSVHLLTDTCKDTHQKISILYDYLKKNTRYLSIQLGIGGWQTYDAEFVAEKGYGDCKALTNFMQALLKEAGIYSCSVRVSAGDLSYRPLEPDFPATVFNHVILCVPLKTDSVWLECTSKDLPSGYLSSFTADRYAMLVNENGGFIVKTPANTIDDNKLVVHSDIYVKQGEDFDGNVTVELNGLFWEKDFLGKEFLKSKTDNRLYHDLTFGNFNILNYKIDNQLLAIPIATEQINLKGNGNIARNGNYIFLSPKIYKPEITPPPTYDERKTPFRIPSGYQCIDTIVYHFTEKIKIENSMNNLEIQYPFGYYKTSMIAVDDNIVKFISMYKIFQGIYPAEQFRDYIALYKKIKTNNKAVLKRIE